MENLTLVSHNPILSLQPSTHHHPIPLFFPSKNPTTSSSHRPRNKVSIFAFSSSFPAKHGHGKNRVGAMKTFATGSGGREQLITSVAVNPIPPTPPPSQFGSPLFWIGVGVGLSALCSWVASYVKKYAMQQAFKTMMGQKGSQSNQFTPAFSPGSPFPYPPPSTTAPESMFRTPTSTQPATSVSPSASQTTVTVDVSEPKAAAAPASPIKLDKETKEEQKSYGIYFFQHHVIVYELIDCSSLLGTVYEYQLEHVFTGSYNFAAEPYVSPDDVLLKTPFDKPEEATTSTSSEDTIFTEEAAQNGAAQSNAWGGSWAGAQSGTGAGAGQGRANPILSVEALEKMMEDPIVQKMIYPYLPEEMRNPATFKWMLQNPMYRQQLEDMLSNMKGSADWDNRMMDTLKNFDLSSPEVKQQFDQIGFSPEQVISKIMENPDLAMAFQNPRVQAAIMDLSQSSLNITKYQHDKEVMDVLNKISELFPGLTR
ncbi:TIC 40, chloroplastic-like protein [Drosera capensis]